MKWWEKIIFRQQLVRLFTLQPSPPGLALPGCWGIGRKEELKAKPFCFHPRLPQNISVGVIRSCHWKFCFWLMWEPNPNKLLQWERSLCVLWGKGNLCIFIKRQMALRQLLELRNKSLKPKVEKFILQYCSFHMPPASQEHWFSQFSFLFFTFVFTMPRFPWFGGLACRIANCSAVSTETKVCLQVYWIIQRIYIFLSLILQLWFINKGQISIFCFQP